MCTQRDAGDKCSIWPTYSGKGRQRNNYLPDLQKRQRWLQPKRSIQVNDVVLVVDDQAPRNRWVMGVVQETYVDKHGLVRSAKIKTKTTTLTRPVTKVCLFAGR